MAGVRGAGMAARVAGRDAAGGLAELLLAELLLEWLKVGCWRAARWVPTATPVSKRWALARPHMAMAAIRSQDQ